jgi:hypothetical protein
MFIRIFENLKLKNRNEKILYARYVFDFRLLDVWAK